MSHVPVEQQIGRLQVAVDDICRVHVLKRTQNLLVETGIMPFFGVRLSMTKNEGTAG